MKFGSCLIAASVAILSCTSSAASTWANKLTITVTGCTAQSAVADVPVPVRIPASVASGMSFPSTGRDLAFRGLDGTVYPHDIDTWNQSGESLVWVRIPSLSQGLQFNMYWGNPSAPEASGAAAWSDYAGVWHLNGNVVDSTGVSAAGTLHANTSTTSGAFGSAISRSDASGANGALASVAASSALSVAPRFSYSLWAQVYDNNIDYAYLLTRKANADNDRAWGLQFFGSCGSEMRVYSAWNWKMTSGWGYVSPASGWSRFDVVYDGTSSVKLYVNGVLKDTFTENLDEPYDGEYALAFGGTAGSGYGTLKGALDEVRLCREVRSDAWVAAAYEAETEENYLSFSSASGGVSGREFAYYASFTPSPAALGDAVLENFPVLVRVSPSAIGSFSYSQCAIDGSDIRFATPSGSVLDFECETWNPGGESLFWVSVPRVSASEGSFRMYWGQGKGVIPSPGSSAGVWSSGNYACVLHMDVGEGYVTTDSAGAFTSATFVNPLPSMVGARGVIGGAYVNANRDSTRAIVLPSEEGKALERAIDSNASNVTISAWVHNESGSGGNYGMLLNTCGPIGGGGVDGIETGVEGSSSKWTVTDNDPSRRVGVGCTDLANGWHLVTLSYATTGVAVYIDGIEIPDLAGSRPFVSSKYWDWTIGARRGDGDAACSWVGGIDEFRVRLGVTSAARARAEYLNVAEGTLYFNGRARSTTKGLFIAIY